VTRTITQTGVIKSETQLKESQLERDEQLLKKPGNEPEVLDQLEWILQVVENETGEAMTADETEELLVQEMRRLGQIAMVVYFSNFIPLEKFSSLAAWNCQLD
jgi:hypothetical protein